MDEQDRRQLGYLIRKARDAKGWNQTQLGRAVGIGRATVGGYETGTLKFPKMSTLEAMAEALDVPVSNFLQEAVTLPEAAAAEIQWLADQLDREYYLLLVELAHSLLRAQHCRPGRGGSPAARPSPRK